MRVLKNVKFMELAFDETITGYKSILQVEVSGQIFTAFRVMGIAEYNDTYPVLRDFIHDSLRTDIMTQIRKKLFEGVES